MPTRLPLKSAIVFSSLSRGTTAYKALIQRTAIALTLVCGYRLGSMPRRYATYAASASENPKSPFPSCSEDSTTKEPDVCSVTTCNSGSAALTRATRSEENEPDDVHVR